jgi:NitT/TauT family transport system substrate-binding protein
MIFTRRIAAALALIVGFASFQPVHAQDKLTVAALRFVSSGGLFLAVDKGYFKQQGIEVDLKFFDAAQPIAVAVVSGDADIGTTAFTAGFYNLAGKGALKVIAAQARERKGYDGNLLIASNEAYAKGLTSADKLPGHSLGITQVGSSFHYQIGQIAAAKKFDLKSVSLKPLQSLGNMAAAVKSGQVDAIIVAPHIAHALVKAGEAKLLARVSDIAEYQFGGFFTSPATIEKKHDLIARFIKAYEHGAADYAAALLQRDGGGEAVYKPGSEKDAAVIGKYVYPSDSAESAIPKVRNSAYYLEPSAKIDVEDIKEQVAWLKEQKLVDQSVDPAAFIDTSFTGK